MPFDQSSIHDVTLSRRDAELAVSWTSSAPAGTWFHGYSDRVRVFATTRRYAVIPYPVGTVRIEVGAVLSSEQHLDLSSQLPGVPGGGSRVAVEWLGGTFLDPDIESFHVYAGDAPGGAVDYSAPVATVTAYPGGIILDGFGLGPFGGGGFGLSASYYGWQSDPVLSGTWHVAVAPVDAWGNEGTPYAWPVSVSGAPQPPARNATGQRVTYSLVRGPDGGFGSGGFGQGGFGVDNEGFGLGGYGLGGFGEGEGDGPSHVVLSWLASPGA